MQPIVKTRIDNSVYNTLLDNIKTGAWKSGDKLPSEAELCSVLQVSRVSVRSALQRLQALGFIEVRRTKGSFVTSFDDFDFSSFDETIVLSEKEFEDIAVLRETVERSAIELIICRTGDINLNRLAEAIQGMKKAVDALDIVLFTQFDLQFHFALFSASGNNKFSRIAQIFKDDFYLYLKEINKFILKNRNDRDQIRLGFENSYNYHVELLNALQNKDKRALKVQERQLGRARESREYYFKNISGKFTAPA